MAYIRERKTKDGRRLYEIEVSRGRGQSPITRRWYAPDGWSKKTVERELNKFASNLERQVSEGVIISRQEIKEKASAEEAERAKLKTVEQYGNGVFMAAKSITFSENSRSSYQSNLDNHVYPVIGDMLLSDVSSPVIQKLLLDFQKNHKQSSCIKLYNILSGLFTMAYLDDSIPADVMRKVKRPTPKKDEKAVDEAEKALTVEALNHVFECIEHEPLKWRAYIHLAADTGCRRGELCGLEWTDVDFINGIVTIRQNVQYTKDKGLYITSPKNGKTRRVDIGDDTITLLQNWRNEQAKECVCKYIFNPEKSNQNKHRADVKHKKENRPISIETKPMHPQTPTAYFRTLRERYDIPNFHPHILRHSSASISLTHGADIASVSARLGHADTAVTLRMYAHANEESIRHAGQVVRDALKAATSESSDSNRDIEEKKS